MKILNKKMSFFFMMLVIFVIPRPVLAAEGADFTITPILGEGQTDMDIGYFSIQAKKGQQYSIAIDLDNLSSDKQHTYSVEWTRASTTDEGRISYMPTDEKKVNKNLLDIADLIESEHLKDKVTIEPGKSQRLHYTIVIPKKGLTGTVLGSFYVKQLAEEKQRPSHLMITNTFSMTIPIVISENFEKKIIPELSLTDAEIKVSEGLPKVQAKISNYSPVMFGEIKMNAWVTQRGKKEKLYERQEENYEMAPNSSFYFDITTDELPLKVGKYTYFLTMKSGDKTFPLKTDFEIHKKDREKISDRLIKSERLNIWLIVSIVLGLLLIVSTVYTFFNKKTDK